MASKLKQFPMALAIVRKYFTKVEEVREATEPIEIEVTAQDSNSAAVRNHESCAMAVACKRTTKADGVIVSMQVAYIIKGKVATRYQLPESVSREIVSFDREAGFAPGHYRLIVAPPTERLENLKYKKSGTNKTTGKPIRHFHRTTGIRTVLGREE
jgi:hypothetical protein